MGFSDQIKEALEDEIDVDFSGAGEKKDFGPIDPGRYTFEVVECEPGVSKEGNPKVTFKVKIAAGQANAGRTFFKHCPTSGAGSGILRDMLEALGMPASKFRPKDALGRQLSLEVRMQPGSDTYQEATSPRSA